MGRLVPHLSAVHGFSHVRAKGIAWRIIGKERLSAADCHKLGIPSQAVTVKRGPERIAIEAVPGLPSDADLNATLRKAGFTA